MNKPIKQIDLTIAVATICMVICANSAVATSRWFAVPWAVFGIILTIAKRVEERAARTFDVLFDFDEVMHGKKEPKE